MNQEILKQVVQEFNNLEHIEGLYLATSITNFILTEKTPIEFIQNFLVKYNNIYSTFKPDNTILTDLYRKRSLNEVYDITKTYFPEYTVEQYFEDFLKLSVEFFNTKRPISIAFCGTVRRFVIHLNHTIETLTGYFCLSSNNNYNKLYFWRNSLKQFYPFQTLLSQL